MKTGTSCFLAACVALAVASCGAPTSQQTAGPVVEKTQPNIFSADETADVGIDNQTLVAEGIGVGAENRFTVKINKITLEVSPAKSAQP